MEKSDKKKYQRTKYICPVFFDEIYLMTGDPKAAESFCSGLEIHPGKTRGKVAEIAEKDSRIPAGFLVWIDSPENFYTMIHEALHLTAKIMEYHGIPFTGENDEFIAYYQNFWVRKFWKTMSKGKNDGKRK